MRAPLGAAHRHDFTYVASPFPGGAIDHFFVAGPMAATFSAAETPNVDDDRYRGSDHRPVFAMSSRQPGGEVGETRNERVSRLIAEVRERLLEIEQIVSEPQ